MMYRYSDGFLHNLDDGSLVPYNKDNLGKLIKVKNTHSLYVKTDYLYVDPEDVMFVWADGGIYLEYYTNTCRTMSNIKASDIISKNYRDLVDDNPSNIVKYMNAYARLLASSQEFWDNDLTINKDKILQTLENIMIPNMTDEQRLVYELSIGEVSTLIDEKNKLRAESRRKR